MQLASIMKIPFAVEIGTGDLVEVGAVASGRACKCVCPGCGQGVLARKGEKKQWHFAHDPDSKYAPERVCDVSFYSCCRRFIVELAHRGVFRTLLTPDLHVKAGAPSFSSETVPGKRLADVTFRVGQDFDLTVEIDSHYIDIHLAYPSRQYPVAPKSGSRGLLVINLDYMLAGYGQRTPSKSLFKQLAIELIENSVVSKHWAYHPKAASIRQRMDNEVSALKLIDRPIASTIPGKKEDILNYIDSNEGSYFCQKCNKQWKSNRSESKVCKNCGSDASTIFWPRPISK